MTSIICVPGPQIATLPHTQRTMLICCQAFVLMKITTHRNILGGRCSRTTQDLMEILPRTPFYVIIANLTPKRVSLPNFMIVTTLSTAFTCLGLSGDGSLMLEAE